MAALALLHAVVLLAGSQVLAAGALSFWESQFSTTEFAQYRYKDLLTVSIFQHRAKNESFYITPLALLDHRSGVLRHNILTGFHELRLKVLMWDPELQDSVRNFLVTKRGIQHPEVKMLPMEKVRFEWRSRSRPLKRSIVMETEYITTHHMPMYLTLTFACKVGSNCEAMHRAVQKHPETLDSLVIDCLMTGQKSATKTITVKVENMVQTKTFAKLMKLPADGSYRYMRADDLNELAKETFFNVRATTVRSSEYVDKNDELSIIQLIQDSLKQDEVYSSRLTKHQWFSVFWDPGFARPDKVLTEASNTFRKNATTSRLEVNSTYLDASGPAQRLFGRTSSGGVNFRDLTGSTGEVSFPASRLNEKLRQAGLNVQWEGERFVTEPIRLVRINAHRFLSLRDLVSHSVQLTAYQQAFSLKVIVGPEYNQTWPLLDNSRSGFPTQFSYCLLSNGGSCPPGFVRSSGHIKAINIDAHNLGMMKTAELGDSAIRCHSPKDSNNCAFRGWEPYKGELHLHVCCR